MYTFQMTRLFHSTSTPKRVCRVAMAAEPPDVRQLAKMANITVSDEEVRDWSAKMNSIVDWFGQLQKINIDQVEPAVRAGLDESNRLRADVDATYAARDELLSSAPDRDGAYVRVPKIMGGVEGGGE